MAYRRTPAKRYSKPTRRPATRRPATRRATTRRFVNQWTKQEVSFMRKYYRRYETAWIARQLGRTVYSIRYKAVDLSIKKASPSIWRGNKGSANAFTGKKATTRRYAKPATRKTTPRRKSPRAYRASSRKYNYRRN